MTAPLDEARLRELADGVISGWSQSKVIYADEAKAILALLDALSAERERSDDARTVLFDFVEQARVGYGGKPVMRSSRVNVPASLFHTVNAFLATQKAEGAT